MACNVNCLIENEGLLKVTASHVGIHYICGNISERVPESVLVATDH